LLAQIGENMVQSITVTLPADVQQALDDASEREGVSREELVSRAIKQHLFLRQFRSLRERMSARTGNQGIVTDQDVFHTIHEGGR
jgi:metal-responsive CopG/Arc/MetJ family transcriptional regulator